MNYNNGIYQYFLGDYVLLFDGNRATALFNLSSDPLQHTNLIGTMPELEKELTQNVKAVIQSYMQRMTSNNLVVR